MGLLDIISDAYMRNVGNPSRQLVGNGLRGLLGLDPADYADTLGMEAYRNAQALGNAPTPLAFAALPAAVVKGAKAAKAVKAAPRDEALETARKNAVTMLGLPENNTAMDRARALGFNIDAYHGSGENITQFDPKLAGTSGLARTGKQKLSWFTDGPDQASGYSGPSKEVKAAYWDAQKRYYDDPEGPTRMDKALSRFNANEGASVYPVKLALQNPIIEDAKGRVTTNRTRASSAMSKLKSGENDGLIIKNTRDLHPEQALQTHFAIYDPSLIRSRFAAFDPARVNENDLLGRADPTLLALIAAGTGGYAVSNRQRRDEPLGQLSGLLAP